MTDRPGFRARLSRRQRSPRAHRKGVHLIPGLFTTGNVFCGFVSIVQASTGGFETAAILILIAALLDALDGRVARLTGTTSEFGREYDSLADVISFGVAPAVLTWKWSLSDYDRLGWGAAFVFVVCGALRLARFNIQTGSSDRRYFVGLPIPAAACAVAACVYYHPQEIESDIARPLSLVLVVILALLMVSKARYRTFKELDLKARRPYVWILPVAITLALIATHPQILLLVAVFSYVVSGMIPRWAPAGRGETITEGAQPASTAGVDHGH